jgi:hemerythrin-like domain-containing protein
MLPAHSRPAPIPGFTSPAAGFDEPLEMLHACHHRVRRSLDLLTRVCERVRTGRVDSAVHEAAADVVRYFDKSAPHHHEDEEQHIFPRVLSLVEDGAVRAAVLRLQEDHQAMEHQWARLRTPLAALARGHAEAFGPEQLESAELFASLYASHMDLEDQVVFPAVVGLIDDEARRAMGAEMAGRRGVQVRTLG